ncbi:MAG: glutamate--tRNA ligase family protein [Puniceicoccaceae bacterium]
MPRETDKSAQSGRYRGRIAPTPSGWLHPGHASTFRTAWKRAREAGGTLVYRLEDIDPARNRDEYIKGAVEDLQWCGLDWDEGPDCGGAHGPYEQSRRKALYQSAFAKLRDLGRIYPSPHSRKDIRAANPVPSPIDGDPIFPPAMRPPNTAVRSQTPETGVNWRFRVPDGRIIRFIDNRLGEQAFMAGRDFGDFIIWKRDNWPAYELAVVVDDEAMRITEVVRGEDLLVSTARQLLLYEAFGWSAPEWYHCELVIDPSTGHRMSKTNKSISLRALRAAGEKAPV